MKNFEFKIIKIRRLSIILYIRNKETFNWTAQNLRLGCKRAAGRT